MKTNHHVITTGRFRSRTIPAKSLPAPSEFKALKNIEYFDFEEDFVEKNMRCIPMIVRFKMDAAGIKLKLAEWSRFEVNERIMLAVMPIALISEVEQYERYLSGLIKKHTGADPTRMNIDPAPDWRSTDQVPEMLWQKAAELNTEITAGQWHSLTDIQRFALLKLCRPGHENKNFPKAMREFKLA